MFIRFPFTFYSETLIGGKVSGCLSLAPSDSSLFPQSASVPLSFKKLPSRSPSLPTSALTIAKPGLFALPIPKPMNCDRSRKNAERGRSTLRCWEERLDDVHASNASSSDVSWWYLRPNGTTSFSSSAVKKI